MCQVEIQAFAANMEGTTGTLPPRHQAYPVSKARRHCTRHTFAGRLVMAAVAFRALFVER
jgi:hypothetical protein